MKQTKRGSSMKSVSANAAGKPAAPTQGQGRGRPPCGALPKGWGELYQILDKLLERRQYLMPFVKEFQCIDGALCKYFEGMPVVIIGAYKVEGRRKENEWHITVLEREAK